MKEWKTKEGEEKIMNFFLEIIEKGKSRDKGNRKGTISVVYKMLMQAEYFLKC